MSDRSNLLLPITMGGIVIFFFAFVGLMWRFGFFNFSETAPSASVVAAALALVGAFLGTIVSLVGVLLKNSFDRQVENRQRIDAERNAALQREGEQRLKLQAAVGALQLFSTSTGTPTTDSQRNGALFALASLGQHDLTLQLVNELLQKKQLTGDTAASLLDIAFASGNVDIQQRAIEILESHTEAFITEDGMILPAALQNWTPGLPVYVREWGMYAIVEVLLQRPRVEWIEKFPYHVNGVVAALALAWHDEKDPRLKLNAAGLLTEVLAAFPDCGTLWHPRMAVNTVEIADKVKGAAPTDRRTVELMENLRQWRAVPEVHS